MWVVSIKLYYSDVDKTTVAWIESFQLQNTKTVKIKCYIYGSHLYCPKEDHPGKLSILTEIADAQRKDQDLKV